MFHSVLTCIYSFPQTCRLAKGVCQAGAQVTPDERTRMAIAWCATVTRLDSLHDPQARAAHSSVSSPSSRLQADTGWTVWAGTHRGGQLITWSNLCVILAFLRSRTLFSYCHHKLPVHNVNVHPAPCNLLFFTSLSDLYIKRLISSFIL